ncbi:MAG: hypothetical protein OCD02_22250 [Spirochaetaceae bacterium]
MKKITLLIILLSLSLFLNSEEGVIGLKNISNNEAETSKNKTNEKVKLKKAKEKINVHIINNNPLLPKANYIGDLGDILSTNKDNNAVLFRTNLFFNLLKSDKKNTVLDQDFSFIFKNAYSDSLLLKNRELLYWYISQPKIYQDYSDLDIELYYRNKILIGTIYLEYESDWFVVDLQLDTQEKGIFDPSIPYY